MNTTKSGIWARRYSVKKSLNTADPFQKACRAIAPASPTIHGPTACAVVAPRRAARPTAKPVTLVNITCANGDMMPRTKKVDRGLSDSALDVAHARSTGCSR